ncbi:MAG: disulfide bond formation protein B [Burkholderiaceae bacterium]|nr:MAG: disulfide bond formation protein B [Burkholderiaceae bacterium]
MTLTSLLFKPRTGLLLIATACFSALGLALAGEHWYGMLPCAWCILQRMVYIVMGLLALVAAAMPDRRLNVAGLWLTLPASAFGIWSAWQQHLAATGQGMSCDLSLADKIINASGLAEVAPDVFSVWALCADAAVSVLGIGFDFWSMTMFGILAATASGFIWLSRR